MKLLGGDAQFEKLSGVQVVSSGATHVRGYFHLGDWPNGTSDSCRTVASGGARRNTRPISNRRSMMREKPGLTSARSRVMFHTPWIALAIVIAGLVAARELRAQAVAITNVTIVDPGLPQPLVPGPIIIEDGRVRAIGPTVRIPPGARVVDGRGGFVVAGLWDMHAHLAALTPVGRAPERYVGHGVLHVRDMGGFTDSLLPLRREIAAGHRVGPDIVLAGPTLNGIQAAPFHRVVTADAEARVAVRELKALGVDFIKVHRAIGREAFMAALDEAQRQGLTVSGHVPLVMGWIEGANAGMRTIEHVQTMPENVQPDASKVAKEVWSIFERLDGALGDSIFAAMRSRGTFFDPTLVGYETTIAHAAPPLAARRREAFDRMKAITLRAARAGVPIVTGTDVLEAHGETLLQELETLVGIGMSPRDVLLAATVTSADAALRPEAGRVTAGGPASFLVLRANPLDDIRKLRSLRMVVLRGRVLDEGELQVLRQ